MKVKDFEGNSLEWPKYKMVDKKKKKSSLHIRARVLLKDMFPTSKIYEEVNMPGSSLYFDFVIPSQKLIIEVQGKQHYEMVKLFHASKLDFLRARGYDDKKRNWCILNQFQLVELKYDESDEQWRKSFSC